jgi:hypothetical protein
MALFFIFNKENWYEQVFPLFLTYILIGLIFSLFIKYKKNGKFDIFHPLIWAGLIYFIPQFVIKSWAIIFLEEDFRMLSLLSNRVYYINLSIGCGILAYISLIAGYYFPVGKALAKFLPDFSSWNWNLKDLKIPSLIIYSIGFVVSFYLLLIGGIGYTVYQGEYAYFHILQLISQFTSYGLFLALFSYFNLDNKNRANWKILIIIITLGQLWWVIAIGSRGYLFSLALLFLAAKQYTMYPTVDLMKLKRPLLLAVLAIIVGIVIGTTFREIKYQTIGYEKAVTPTEVIGINKEVLRITKTQSASELKDFILNTLLHRLDSLDSLAVVLNYAQQVKHQEIAYGIDNNIIKDLLWGFVPRFIWPDKPIISEFPIKFGIIYFNNPNSAYIWSAMTVMGDLYRNFGFIGLFIGMSILGVTLRVLYSWLIERKANGPFNFLLYYFMLRSINYEGAYAGIFTLFMRNLIFILLAGLIVHLIIHFNNKLGRIA